MIENFGNIFYLIIHILVTGLFGVYVVRIYFSTSLIDFNLVYCSLSCGNRNTKIVFRKI